MKTIEVPMILVILIFAGGWILGWFLHHWLAYRIYFHDPGKASESDEIQNDAELAAMLNAINTLLPRTMEGDELDRRLAMVELGRLVRMAERYAAHDPLTKKEVDDIVENLRARLKRP